MKKAAALLTLCLAATSAAAAEPQGPPAPEPFIRPIPKTTLEKAVTEEVRRIDKSRFITLNTENDMYGGGSDSNYTSGMRLTYFDLGMEVPELARTIDQILPTFDINETTSIYYSFGHNLYTPRDIEQAAQDPNDRPWAAFMYVSAGLVSITDNHTDSVEATLGVVGPLALGEPIQKFVHKHISDSPEPQGWDNQLENEPGLMLSWERSWAGRFSIDSMGWTAGAVPHVGATVGNIYTYANTGITFRLSPYEGRLQDDPIRVRPSMPGTGAFILPEKTFSWYLFGGIEGRAVARNIFLDGNTFTDSHSVDKKTFVGDASAGVAFTYGRARLSYAIVYRTKEFDDAPKGDVFGTISLGYRF